MNWKQESKGIEELSGSVKVPENYLQHKHSAEEKLLCFNLVKQKAEETTELLY